MKADPQRSSYSACMVDGELDDTVPSECMQRSAKATNTTMLNQPKKSEKLVVVTNDPTPDTNTPT